MDTVEKKSPQLNWSVIKGSYYPAMLTVEVQLEEVLYHSAYFSKEEQQQVKAGMLTDKLRQKINWVNDIDYSVFSLSTRKKLGLA